MASSSYKISDSYIDLSDDLKKDIEKETTVCFCDGVKSPNSGNGIGCLIFYKNTMSDRRKHNTSTKLPDEDKRVTEILIKNDTEIINSNEITRKIDSKIKNTSILIAHSVFECLKYIKKMNWPESVIVYVDSEDFIKEINDYVKPENETISLIDVDKDKDFLNFSQLSPQFFALRQGLDIEFRIIRNTENNVHFNYAHSIAHSKAHSGNKNKQETIKIHAKPIIKPINIIKKQKVVKTIEPEKPLAIEKKEVKKIEPCKPMFRKDIMGKILADKGKEK